jgi:hypothetical protein
LTFSNSPAIADGNDLPVFTAAGREEFRLYFARVKGRNMLAVINLVGGTMTEFLKQGRPPIMIAGGEQHCISFPALFISTYFVQLTG